MIQEDIFSKTNAITFSQALEQIHVGDLIFCSGNSAVSHFIREATASVFSHVGLLLRMPMTGQWLVLESVESIGVRCVTLLHGYLINYQDSGRGYDGNILIARHQQVAQKSNAVEALYRRAFELTGDKYSTADIFRIAARIALNKMGVHEDGIVKENDRYICSEYVYACLKAIDIHLPYNPLGFIAPADIAGHAYIHPVCHLAAEIVLPAPAVSHVAV